MTKMETHTWKGLSPNAPSRSFVQRPGLEHELKAVRVHSGKWSWSDNVPKDGHGSFFAFSNPNKKKKYFHSFSSVIQVWNMSVSLVRELVKECSQGF